jgi:hypothetical protein
MAFRAIAEAAALPGESSVPGGRSSVTAPFPGTSRTAKCSFNDYRACSRLVTSDTVVPHLALQCRRNEKRPRCCRSRRTPRSPGHRHAHVEVKKCGRAASTPNCDARF